MRNSCFLLVAGLVMLTGCSQQFDVGQHIGYCHQQVKRSLSELAPIDYTQTPRNIGPEESHWNLKDAKTSEEWCSGFFPGILWMCGEKEQAARYTQELECLAYRPAYDHDLGFQMIGSFLKGWQCLDEKSDAEKAAKDHYRQVLIDAADTLATLFNPRVGTLLSWPRNVGMFGGHNTIIDNMINLELLFWADQQLKEGQGSTYDGRLSRIAVSHADTTMRYHFREDGTINHVAVYDTITGRHIRNCNHQGYDDNSLWSRGQAWAIYGYTMVYRYTRDAKYLDFAQKVTDVMLSQLPEDHIPYWDMRDPKLPDTYRDASAAAIIASALIELAGYVEQDKAQKYIREAQTILETLSSADYQSRDRNPAFLLHSVGNMPAGSEIDASIIYADYYYIEALTRFNNYRNTWK